MCKPEIKELVSKHLFYKKRLAGDSRLFHDLGIDGDTAEELLIEFRDLFDVDLSQFRFNEYFGGEVGAGLRFFLMRIGEKFGINLVKLKPLTLQDLDLASREGVLI